MRAEQLQPGQQEGMVVCSTGKWYTVLMGNERVECRLRGRIRLKGVRSTNPVAVGDRVIVELPENPETHDAAIVKILPRQNYMIRRATNLSKETHIIAANLDLAVLVVTLVYPPTLLEFIDRFLATATAYRIPAVVALNKQDLPEEQQAASDLAIRPIYETAGYEVLALSAETGMGLERLKELLKGKITLFSGNSGVGKSSLLNALYPGLGLRVGELSTSYHLGRHTTAHSEMFTLDAETKTFAVDTPGIKGFGVVEFEKEEISHFFPEIFRLGDACQFGNCSHVHEPGCAVLEALDEGQLALSRYNSYYSLLMEEDYKYR